MKYIRLLLSTSVIGFGLWWGFLIITTFHGLLAEANESLAHALNAVAIVLGAVAAATWFYRRLGTRPVRVLERVVFGLAALSLAYLGYFFISGEVQSFVAFDPVTAARRDAEQGPVPRGELVARGKYRRVHEFGVVTPQGKTEWIIGVAPRFVWWTHAYSMSADDYERSSPHSR